MPDCQAAEVIFTAIIGTLMVTLFLFSLREGPSGTKGR